MRKIIILSFALANLALSQDKSELKTYFKLAGDEFGVPHQLLEAIAYVNTRWVNIQPENIQPSCLGQPPVYGIMGLRDDNWFGHSLIEGAKLIEQAVEVVKKDVYQNIRASSALLAKYFNESGLRKGIPKIEDYKSAVAKFSGIPQPEIAELFAYDVYKTLANGVDDFGIEKMEIDMTIFPKNILEKAGLKVIRPDEIKSEDYPPAVWDPSPNYTPNRPYTTRIVIHVTQGSFAGSVSWLKNPQSQASAHYIIRSADGYIVQLVREKDKAWHARCWNSFTLGIEHEGYIENPSVWFTPVMYLESAKLVKNMVKRWGVPVDSNHIIGHNFWRQPQWPVVRQEWDFATYDPASTYPTSCNNHTDPGSGWNWQYYLALIRGDSTPPKIVSTTIKNNQTDVIAYKSIVINFSLPMEKNSVESNLKITPTDTITLAWSSDYTSVEIKPNKFWEFSTTYTIKIDTGAKSVFGIKIDGNGDGIPGDPFILTFTTTQPDIYPPIVEKGFPIGENVSIYAEMKFVFNEIIDGATLASRVKFYDENDQSVSFTSGRHVIKNDKSVVTFKPSTPMQSNKIYKVVFKSGIKDLFGNPTGSDYTFQFRTEPGTYYRGTIIDSFESIGQWWKPQQSDSTIGIDTAQTSFTIANDRKFSGTYSGKLVYKFTLDSGGVVRLFNGAKPSVPQSANSIGVWIFGDLSGNQLEFWFYNPNNYIANLGEINWYGWKFVSIPASSIPGTNRQFHSFVIRQKQNADHDGEIYFDDLQIDGKITFTESDAILPSKYSLLQNYPNPFNSSTVIEFEIPRREFVKLYIYDILGRTVQVLASGEFEPGKHRITFDLSDLSSGIYFYRIIAGSFTDVKKMVLLK